MRTPIPQENLGCFFIWKSLISRYLPPPPAVIFDVGGGAGVYSFWLAQQGYEVHLIDAIPLHRPF
ncbi:methyltransferase domain-containing protein [Nostoc sp.]